MAQVPYSPVPEIRPQLDPTPRPQIDTPLAAFGGLTAEATSHFGGALDKVGDELFARAAAMQEMNQQAAADRASVDAATQMGQLHAKYTTLTGDAAVQAYPQYQKDLADVVSKSREGLESPYAQQYYDRDTRRFQMNYLTTAGSYAAQQNKQFNKDTLKASTDVTLNQVGVNPLDQNAWNANLDKVKQNASQAMDLDGVPADSPIRTAKIDDEISKATARRISEIAKSQPQTAQTYLDDAMKRGDLKGGDALNAYNAVKNQQYTVGARNISAETTAGHNNWVGEQAVNTSMARTGIKGIEGGNYEIMGPQTYKNGQPAGQGLGAYQVMEYNLAPWLKEAGMAPMTSQQFLKDHTAQDQLFDFKFGQLQQQYGSFNKAARVWFTGSPNAPDDASDRQPGFKGHTVEQYLTSANAAMARTAPSEMLADHAGKLADNMSSGDDVLRDHAVRQTLSVHADDQKVQRDNEFQARTTIDNAINNYGPNGKLPTSPLDIIMNDKTGDVQKAWDAADPEVRAQYMKQFERNAGDGYAKTPENQMMFQRYLGIGLSPQSSPSDLKDFLSQDFGSKAMPQPEVARLIKLQGEVFKNSAKNPALNSALSMLANTDPAVRQILSQDKNSDDRNQFTGALHEAIEQYMELNKKPPNDKDLQVIGAQLMRGMHSQHFWFQSSTSPLYNVPVPDKDKDQITEALTSAGQPVTDAAIRKVFIANRFNEFFTKGTMTDDGK